MYTAPKISAIQAPNGGIHGGAGGGASSSYLAGGQSSVASPRMADLQHVQAGVGSGNWASPSSVHQGVHEDVGGVRCRSG